MHRFLSSTILLALVVLFAIVFQVGRRKPVLKKALGQTGGDDAPDSECPAPAWERRPVRVTFESDETRKSTYAVRGQAADLVSDEGRGGGKGFAINKAERAQLHSCHSQVKKTSALAAAIDLYAVRAGEKTGPSTPLAALRYGRDDRETDVDRGWGRDWA